MRNSAPLPFFAPLRPRSVTGGGIFSAPGLVPTSGSFAACPFDAFGLSAASTCAAVLPTGAGGSARIVGRDDDAVAIRRDRADLVAREVGHRARLAVLGIVAEHERALRRAGPHRAVARGRERGDALVVGVEDVLRVAAGDRVELARRPGARVDRVAARRERPHRLDVLEHRPGARLARADIDLPHLVARHRAGPHRAIGGLRQRDDRDRAVDRHDLLHAVAGQLVDRAVRVRAEQHAAVGELERAPHRVAFERGALRVPARANLAVRRDERGRRVAGIELLVGLDRPGRGHDGVRGERHGCEQRRGEQESLHGESPQQAYYGRARTRARIEVPPAITRRDGDSVRAMGLYGCARWV